MRHILNETSSMSHIMCILWLRKFITDNLIIMSCYCRKVLKILLDSLSNDSKTIQVEVLQTLIDMLKCSELTDSFSLYPELLILKVIYAYKSDDQKVDPSSGSGGRSPVSIINPIK